MPNHPITSGSDDALAANNHAIPSSILIVGSGVFGLSTALALTARPEFASTSITVLDRSPTPGVFPARDASSIDTSRIIRPDYADPAYAALAAEAQALWRRSTGDPANDLGGEGRYSEKGLMVVADLDEKDRGPGKRNGLGYTRSSWANVKALASSDPSLAGKVEELPNAEAIRATYGTGGCVGSWGYLNRMSGWADAEASMDWLYRRVVATKRVKFVNGTAESLLRSPTDDAHVIGVKLSSSSPTGGHQGEEKTMLADLTILATGAWTPSLIPLSGRAVATGQVLAYMAITPAEQVRLADVPTFLHMSTGYFIITPANGTLKIARHAYGYLNPTTTSEGGVTTTISTPVTHLTHPHTAAVPHAEQVAMRRVLRAIVPWPELRDRPFTGTRLCWYTDTPDGDFIIDYHPDLKGLFVATGGSGHGFKFLPVIGDKITDCVLGKCPEAFRGKWAFNKHGEKKLAWDKVVTEDGSRGGVQGVVLQGDIDKTPSTDGKTASSSRL